MWNPTTSDSFWRPRRAVDGDRHSIALQSSAMYSTNYAPLRNVVATVAMEQWRSSGDCSVFVFHVAAESLAHVLVTFIGNRMARYLNSNIAEKAETRG
jgi:hypothetical protein